MKPPSYKTARYIRCHEPASRIQFTHLSSSEAKLIARSVIDTERKQLVAAVNAERLAPDCHLERRHFRGAVNDIATLLVVVVRWRIERSVVCSSDVGRDVVESGTRVKDGDVARGGQVRRAGEGVLLDTNDLSDANKVQQTACISVISGPVRSRSIRSLWSW